MNPTLNPMTSSGNLQTPSPFISVVVPVYGCDESLPELYKRLVTTLSEMNTDFEMILVNDASPDDSWNQIVALTTVDSRVKGINLSRNFGQHYAITAGLDYANGHWVVVMDCDLQDQPEEILKLHAKAMEGFDIVYARRAVRQDSFLKRLSSRAFFAVFDYLTEQKSDPAIANFGIYSHKVIENFRNMRESVRSFPLFVRWLGFRSVAVDVAHASRFSGISSYTFQKLIQLALSVIISHTNRPLRLSIGLGFSMAGCSLLVAFYFVMRYILHDISVEGWTSLMVSMFFLAGLVFVNMGNTTGTVLLLGYDQ